MRKELRNLKKWCRKNSLDVFRAEDDITGEVYYVAHNTLTDRVLVYAFNSDSVTDTYAHTELGKKVIYKIPTFDLGKEDWEILNTKGFPKDYYVSFDEVEDEVDGFEVEVAETVDLRKEGEDMIGYWDNKKDSKVSTEKKWNSYKTWDGLDRTTLAFEADGVKFYGSKRTLVKDAQADAYVCLLESNPFSGDKVKVTGFGIFENLTQEFDTAPENLIHLPVADYAAPVYTPEFIKTIYDTIKASGVKSVVVFCAGGKGRTGTLLAAFASLAETLIDSKGQIADLTKEHPVDFIRRSYHSSAVETTSQKEWVAKVWKFVRPNQEIPKSDNTVTSSIYDSSYTKSYGKYYNW